MGRALAFVVSSFLVCAFSSLVCGAPIGIPDLTQCQTATATSPTPPIVTLTFNCCLPIPNTPVAFTLPSSPQCHVRQPAHLVDSAYIAKYGQAYQLMRDLPSSDPRSFGVQANIHCAFCNSAYKQPGTNVTMQVHFSWLFLSWHRWYLYFHERILAKLIGDPSFSLVFWNWDNQLPAGEPTAGGNILPEMFAAPNTSLYDAKRNPAHAPPALVRLSPLSTSNNNTVIINENLNNMYQGVVMPSTVELFYGDAYRLGTDISNSTVVNAPLAGSIEQGVHNAIHFWTGDNNTVLFQDMGNFATAARDPIFYAHHSNVDRLWEVWKTLPNRSSLVPTDPDFLDTEFVFFDENGTLVKVRAGDALDNHKLGIRYTSVRAGDNFWINYQAQVTTNGSEVSRAQAEGVTEFGPASSSQAPRSLGQRFRALVRLPNTTTNSSQDEVLVLQGLRATRDRFAELRVFVNLPDADQNTPTFGAEFVGTFNIIPVPFGSHVSFLTNVRFAIGGNLKRIGIANNAVAVIVIVPVTGTSATVNATLQGVQIVNQ